MLYLARVIDLFFSILTWAIIIRALLSWFQPNYQYRRQFYRVNRFLAAITDPVIDPIRRVGSMSAAGLDFTPLIAILLLEVLHRVVMLVLFRLL